MPKSFLSIAAAVLTALTACSRPHTSQVASPGASATPSVASQPAIQQIDACSLLTREEIELVQGEAATGTTPSGGTLGGFPSTQCVFMTATPVNSVSVVITQSASKSSPGVREFWEKTFHRQASDDAPGGDKEGEEEREKRRRPRKFQT